MSTALASPRSAETWRYATSAGVGLLVLAACFGLGYALAVRTTSDGSTPPPANAAAPQARGASAALAREPAEAASAATPKSGTGLAWPLWEYRLQEPLPAREEPLTPVPWRLLGAALFDGRWHAIVQRQGVAQPEYFKQGDKLPGGFVIKEITQEDLTLRAGKREILLTYIGTR